VRFAYIDALRGYAILGVMIVHGGQSVEGIASLLTTWGRAALLMVVTLHLAHLYYGTGLDFLPAVFPDQKHDLLAVLMFLSIPNQIAAFAAGILAFHSIELASAKLPRWSVETALLGAVALIIVLAYTNVHDVPDFGLLFGVVATTMGLGAGCYLDDRFHESTQFRPWS
jgi:peptidoglycan/LPS O-acetylase OafA/YrhL